ncbi:hypothetical protein AGDE_14400 [Angomonas deanei]|nr:hypothetical protein AGDE_14400 [Angomonas deanei]|eukprot:EPY20924.1 hypothetical protein AGDE_14400 [Angomonas deanei]
MTTKQALQRILEQRITICPDAAEDSETLLFLSGGRHDATDATTEETYLSTRLLQPTFTGANSNVNSVAGLLTSPRRGGSTNKREDSYQNASPSPARGSGRYLSNNNVKSFDSVLDCPQPIIRPYSYTSDTGAEVDLYYAGARRRSSANTVFNNHAMRKSSNAISLPMESAVHNSTNSSNKSVDADGNSLWSRVPLKQER